MATILAMKKRFEAFNAELEIVESMKSLEPDLRDLNLEQMYDGKTREGVDITPSYLNDPYWNDKGGQPAAQAYSDWKDQITPNPRRNPGTPNLFINGYFHGSINAVVAGDVILFNSYFKDEPDIRARFKKIYGLGGRHKRIFLNDYLMPVLKERVLRATGLLMK